MRDAKTTKPARAAHKRAPGLRRVLVVEDDAVLALALEDALRDVGVREVVICPSRASTVEALEQGDADAVVLDVHLADGDDGWALAELIEQLGPKRPRIFFSTGSPEDIPPKIAELGLVFSKPYDPAELAAELTSGEQRRGLFSRLRGAMS
ncbi:MAG: response regulator [Croceibacterium sp.]